MKQLFIHPIIVVLIISFCTCRFCLSQDAEQVKKSAAQSISRIENYPVVIAKGKYVSTHWESQTSYQVRGQQIWREYRNTHYGNLQAEQEERSQEVRRITGDFDAITAFDGKNNYDFEPGSLEVRIEPARVHGSEAGFPSMLPQGWLSINGGNIWKFKVMIELKSPEVKVDALGDNRWKISQQGYGDDKEEAVRKRWGVRNWAFIVDSRVDFLVTEYETDGAQGKLTGSIDWEKQDGFWYAKHGKHIGNGKLRSEWTISEISFDARKCRARFDDLENVVPFATHVMVKDSSGKMVKEFYTGGKAGEEEHKLRKLAISKIPFPEE